MTKLLLRPPVLMRFIGRLAVSAEGDADLLRFDAPDLPDSADGDGDRVVVKGERSLFFDHGDGGVPVEIKVVV